MKEISKNSCFKNTDPCRNVACKSVNLKITSYIDEVTSVFGACNFANFTDYIVPTITVRVNPVLSDLNISETSRLDCRYFEHNRINDNELQIRKILQKGTGTKMS